LMRRYRRTRCSRRRRLSHICVAVPVRSRLPPLRELQLSIQRPTAQSSMFFAKSLRGWRPVKLSTGIVIVLASMATVSAPERRPLGAVDFFGYQGLDVAAVRTALPFHEGDSFPPPKVHSDQLKKQVADAIERVIGHKPTDVAFICCDAK